MSQVAMDLILGVGMDNIRAQSLELSQLVLDAADALKLEVITPRAPEQRGGVVALKFPNDAQVTRRLVARGFVCSHRGALRVAPHFYNTRDEVHRFMEALAEETRR